MSSNEWAKTTLGSVVNILSGGTPSTRVPEYWSDEIKWVTAKDVSESSGYKIYDSDRKISKRGLENSPANIIPKEATVLIARGATMGRCCMLGEDMAINQTCFALAAKEGKIHPYFLFYSIKNLNDYFQKIAHGAIFNTVIGSGLRETEISLPSLSTQRRIVDILSALDEKIELNRQVNMTLEAMAQAVFREWFIVGNYDLNDEMKTMITGNKNHSPSSNQKNHGADGALPQGWRVGKLEEIITNYDSKRVPISGQEREKRKGIYPYYGAASIVDYIDGFLFDGVYLLMGEDGTVITDDDKPVLQYVTGKFWVNNHTHVLRGKGIFSTEFVYLALKNTNIKHIVTGAVQPKVNQGNMNSLPVIIPDAETLKAFQEVIKPIFAYILESEQQSAILAAVRDALLPKLMSGEIEV